MGIEISMKLDQASLQELESQLTKALSESQFYAEEGLLEVGHLIMDESRNQVPTVTGALADSGYVEGPTNDGAAVTVRVGYGGPNNQVNTKTHQTTSEYMLAVHENLNVQHPTGKAKYLEDPVNDIGVHSLGPILVVQLQKAFEIIGK